jgi:hypothetical protein
MSIHAGHSGTAVPGSPLGGPVQAVQSAVSPCPPQSGVSPSPVTPPQPHAARPFFLRVFASSRLRVRKNTPLLPCCFTRSREGNRTGTFESLSMPDTRALPYPARPWSVLCRWFKVLCPRPPPSPLLVVQSAVSPSPLFGAGLRLKTGRLSLPG